MPLGKSKDDLDVPAVARECGVAACTVRRWMSPGIRVGGERVKLVPDRVIGTRCVVSRATLAKFEASCAQAKFGDDAATPADSPAQSLARRKAAQDRVATQLGGGCSPRKPRPRPKKQKGSGGPDEP